MPYISDIWHTKISITKIPNIEFYSCTIHSHVLANVKGSVKNYALAKDSCRHMHPPVNLTVPDDSMSNIKIHKSHM